MLKATILAVDDDPIILEIYKLILDNEHTIHLVSSGKEALGYLDTCPKVDLILLDIMMPDIDGYEVCRRIRSNNAFSNLKIILVSSKMLIEDRLFGYEIGADDYIIKPFEASELLAKVKVFLRLKNAEEINKIKTNLINLLSHETRTPLTAIFGYIRLLRESEHLIGEEKTFVDEIQRCGEKLLQSCEKTLLLSDLKLGQVRIEKANAPLSLFFSGYRQTFEQNEKRCTMRFSGDETLRIDADLKLFTIAISALLDNAVKFAREGSAVEVRAHRLGDRLRIEVANDGEKIPVEQQEEIFNLLSVQDIAHHHQGYGLSLAISRQIIEAHDGTVTVSNHDHGPVFLIEIGLATAAEFP
jgi:two-component system, sensor histidine kinase and response regulator